MARALSSGGRGRWFESTHPDHLCGHLTTSGFAMKRVHAYFSGLVQGVGFRYTAIRLARRAGVTGWARNLYDGRVEILAEGAEATLEQFVRELREYFNTYVRDTHVEWLEATGEFAEFGVRF